ncbi:hypothetical protein H6B10_16910, partial [Gemmiger formicilis]|uniref:hypothetical protein n=1 Tax=Gemmiger formicilis TaxID=745368 RepID=UPI00195D7E41
LYGGQKRFSAFTEALAEYRRLARTLPVDRLMEELLARTSAESPARPALPAQATKDCRSSRQRAPSGMAPTAAR